MIEKIAFENKFNLEAKTKEEAEEFLVALDNYRKYREYTRKLLREETTVEKRNRQKLFEEVLHEIADCEVMRMQNEYHSTNFKLCDIIGEDKYQDYKTFYANNEEYIKTVVAWKIARTELRNKVNYYK